MKELFSIGPIHTMHPAILYNADRVVAYTVIGVLVGAFGSVLSL